VSAADRSPWARAAHAFRWVENLLLVALLGGLVLLASTQIVLRNFFSLGLTWADGLIRLMVLWLALVGAVAAAREGRHITMAALTRWLPKRWQRVARGCAEAFAAAASGFLAWYSWVFVRDSYRYEDVLLDGLPAWTAQLPIPIAFGLIGLTYAAGLLRTIGGR
jgi:TRAP-type C4-dicarboxylate transport system permease small subunit